MNKDTFIKICNDNFNSKLKKKDIINLIIDYCIEMGKDYNKSLEFANLIIQTMNNPFQLDIYSQVISICFDYYNKKYNTITVIYNNTPILTY